MTQKKEKNPPAPHPRWGNNVPELPPDHNNPMVKQLKEDLESVYKDIDLNYRRLGYRQRSTKRILLIVMNLLAECIKLLPIEEEEAEEKEKEEQRQDMPFSTSKDGIS